MYSLKKMKYRNESFFWKNFANTFVSKVNCDKNAQSMWVVSAGKYIRFKHRRTFFFYWIFHDSRNEAFVEKSKWCPFKINKIIESTLKTCTVISFRLGTNYKNTRDKNRQIFLAPFPCIFQTTISSDSSLDSYLERDLHRPLPILLLFWLSIM